ncbi:hypothetical protein LDENG_00242480 [Lucifuga dentata]|nr:hypothetical protein LDENG_00242480 [Lucifuga dentata]
MPSDFLTPFLELDEEFCKSFRGLEMTDGSSTSSQQQQQQRVLGFQRRHSLCPVTLPNSKFNSSNSSEVTDPTCWGLNVASNQQWSREGQLPRSLLSHIPFRVDRSVSMIEGNVSSLASREETMANLSPPLLLPPPGLCITNTSLSSNSSSFASKPSAPSPHISTRYKTELCRTYEESGACKYGAKCQFAHGMDELRGLSRHPKYKTEPCRTFHTIGFCPYGARCHFIHNADELHAAAAAAAAAASPQKQKLRPPLLRHSISFAGFSSRCPTSTYTTKNPNLLYNLPQQLPISLNGLSALQRYSSADSLSEEGYTSSCSLSSSSSGTESPSFEGRRLPIFSRLSVSDE